MIQQLGEFFRRAAGVQRAESTEVLETHLEQLTDEILGLPSSIIMSLPPQELIELFELSDRMVIEKCYVTAEIHRLRAEVEEDPQSKLQFKERSVFFYDAVLPDLEGDLKETASKHLLELKSEIVS